jgi:putative ABC transport system substrate-binding protein
VIDRRTFLCGLTLCALPTRSAHGQLTTRRIGFLSPFPRADIDEFLGLLRPELEKLGWTNGRNIMLLEPRTTEGANDRLPSVAAELVSQGPDLILVQSVPATRALMLATKSIPIVMAGVGNPVELGIVANFGKPGGNVTGSSYLANEYARKLLQLLKEAAPRLRSVAVFVNSSNDAATPLAANTLVKQMRADAVTYGMQAQIVDVSRPSDFEAAFVAIRSANTQSILLPPEALIRSKRDAIADFAQTHGLPLAVVGDSRQLPAGGLLAYGPARAAYAQLAARYVDQILKGAKPGDLSVEQPTKFHLVINLKTAKVLGLTIPQSLLLRADEVIQ